MHLNKTITPLLWRVIVFLGLFLIISGTIGPRIISGGILYRDGFAIYGGIGKALIFGLISFVLLVRHNTTPIKLRAWQPILLLWIVSSTVLFILAWLSVSKLLSGERNLQIILSAHLEILASTALALIGCLGPKNIKLLWTSYKKEIISSVVIAGLFYVFLLAVYALWRPLATTVMFSVKGLLEITGLHSAVIRPNTLIFDKFGITVAQYCSGIESIALFTGLYAIVGLLDWDKLNKRRYYIVFPIALLVLFIFNIFRVFGLILAGYYINPRIAFSLFHTYAGMVFFIIYSAIFWAIAYKYLLKGPIKEKMK